MKIVVAGPEDAQRVATLVNRAYEVERFFVEGDRTSAVDVGEAIRRGTVYLALDEGRLAGCVLVEVSGAVGSFGMLAVEPDMQGRGIGRALIDRAEDHVRAAGAATMEILVVNLREELLPIYRRLGYQEVGDAPYVHRPILRACHFIRMAKALY